MRTAIRTTISACVLLLASQIHAQEFDQEALIEPLDGPLEFIFVPKLVHPWYDVMQAGMDNSIAELAEQGIEVNYTWDAQPTADVDQHNRRIEAAIARQPDALAVSCLDPGSNISLMKEAKAAGIQVITFDTYCSDEFKFVGHRYDAQDGRDLAKVLAEHIGGEGEVGILQGSPTAANHVARIEGFKAELAENWPNIEIVFERPENDQIEEAVTITENAMQAHPNLKGIFAPNASAPIGAGRALEAIGKSGEVAIVGMDALPETIALINSDVILAVKAQRQWDLGYWIVKYMVAAKQNHTTPHEHGTGTFLMTKENAPK